MKIAIACLIASFLLLSFIDFSEGTSSEEDCGCTKSTTRAPPTTCRTTRPPSTTCRTTRPPTTRPPPTTRRPRPTTRRPRPTRPWRPCEPCGPAGKACPGCPEQGELCKDLLAQLQAIENKIRVCVCGQSRWLV